MDDAQIQTRIEELEQEEKRLRKDEEAQAEAGRTDAVGVDAGRLAAIKVELDQLWDLLRQRRALRAAGRNPDDARMRDSETVERYLGFLRAGSSAYPLDTLRAAGVDMTSPAPVEQTFGVLAGRQTGEVNIENQKTLLVDVVLNGSTFT